MLASAAAVSCERQYDRKQAKLIKMLSKEQSALTVSKERMC